MIDTIASGKEVNVFATSTKFTENMCYAEMTIFHAFLKDY